MTRLRGRLTEDERALLRSLIHSGRVLRSLDASADLVDAMCELDVSLRTTYVANVALRAYALYVVRFIDRAVA